MYTIQMWREIENLYGLIIQKTGFLDMSYHWEILRHRKE